MNRLNNYAISTLALCVAISSTQVLFAQSPQNWRNFKQRFIAPKYPTIGQTYEHKITLDNGKFVTVFSRDFGTQGLFTGVVIANLVDIDVSKMKIIKGGESYSPEYWYLYVPVKNPNNAPARVLATPQTDRAHLIVKHQTEVINGKKKEEVWILTQMYLNFDNEAAAQKAAADIAAASK